MSPYCASRSTIGTFRLAANQLSTRCDCAVTSGPMPSPPTTATLIMLDRLFMPISLQMDPRPHGAVGRLKSVDFVVTLQRQRDFIKTAKQPGAPTRIDLETDLFPRGRIDRLCLEIDADTPGARGVLDLGGEAVADLLAHHDREDAVLKTIGEENIAEARADNGA